MLKGCGALVSFGSLEGDSFLARAGRAAEGLSDSDCGADMKTLVLALRDESVSAETQEKVRHRLEEVLGLGSL